MRPSLRSLNPDWRSPKTCARAPDLEILLREHETVGARGHRRQALLAVLGRRVGEQEAVRAVAAAPDAAAELVQLREPEPVGVLDDHHRRVRDVDADLDHRRRDEHVELPGAKRAHHRLLLLRRHLAVQQADPQVVRAPPPAAVRTPRSRPSPRPCPCPPRAGTRRRPGARPRPRRAALAHAAACASGLGSTRVVSIGVRPGGSSRSSDLSRSP